MAEGLFRKAVGNHPDITVSSAGVGAVDGQSPSTHSVTALRGRGIDISGVRSRALTSAIVSRSTHIFAMTRGHFDLILTFFPEAAERTYLVREFMPQAGDIADPIGQGPEVYLRCCEQIEAAIPSLLDFILKDQP